ncbi:hypothetical protein CEXT_656181 [Caerostris extrusa]|uniref:Uncharacterized protein n=1 Tax=Caerostris extrusa TaxID=172846 RepID=A0AAV4MXT0_CAEEX|nr:hypothetical protein CEXT_656181 [Caerostris extrusa]
MIVKNSNWNDGYFLNQILSLMDGTFFLTKEAPFFCFIRNYHYLYCACRKRLAHQIVKNSYQRKHTLCHSIHNPGYGFFGKPCVYALIAVEFQ